MAIYCNLVFSRTAYCVNMALHEYFSIELDGFSENINLLVLKPAPNLWNRAISFKFQAISMRRISFDVWQNNCVPEFKTIHQLSFLVELHFYLSYSTWFTWINVPIQCILQHNYMLICASFNHYTKFFIECEWLSIMYISNIHLDKWVAFSYIEKALYLKLLYNV